MKEHVSPVPSPFCSPIGVAAENGHLEMVNRLLEDSRVDPSAANNRAIQYASKNGHLKIVRILLEDFRVDPSAANNFAIHFASKNDIQVPLNPTASKIM